MSDLVRAYGILQRQANYDPRYNANTFFEGKNNALNYMKDAKKYQGLVMGKDSPDVGKKADYNINLVKQMMDPTNPVYKN